MFPMPELARYKIKGEPRPPAPITRTFDEKILFALLLLHFLKLFAWKISLN